MNNHGWGLKEMLVFCAILIFFLLLATFLISRLYSSLELGTSNETTKENYSSIENNLKVAAQKYYKDLDEEINIIFSDELLEENYITKKELTPSNSKYPCDGYVEINDNKRFNAYISCEDYETRGY